jgi:putative flippase GtrA
MNNRLRAYSGIFKYGVVGVLGTLVHIGVLAIMVEVFQVNAIIGSIIGFIGALLSSYLLNYHWTFESTHDHLSSFTRYLLVSLVGLGLNTLLMYLTVTVLKWWYIYGQLTVILVVPATNYVLNRFWTFRENHPEEQIKT